MEEEPPAEHVGAQSVGVWAGPPSRGTVEPQVMGHPAAPSSEGDRTRKSGLQNQAKALWGTFERQKCGRQLQGPGRFARATLLYRSPPGPGWNEFPDTH